MFVILVLFAIAPTVAPGQARGADPAAALADAQAAADGARADIGELENELKGRKATYSAISRRASVAERAAERADAEVEAMRSRIEERASTAREEIDAVEAAYEEEEDRYESEVTGGVDFFLAALIIAVLSLAWGWFRASTAVAGLTELGAPQAIGLTLGAGLLLLLVGAALLDLGGLTGTLGGLIAILGVSLPVAFLLARHSAEVQRGRSKPVLGRERMPRWVTGTLVAAFGLVGVVGLVSAVAADPPSRPEIARGIRAAASEAPTDAESRRLARLEAADRRLGARASRLQARKERAFASLAQSRRDLRRARRRLSSAESDIKLYANRLKARERRETREAERERRRVEEEAEEEAAAECHPSYSGCLDPNASDYDCAGGSGDGPLYTDTVTVKGPDVFDLDSDGDGIACES